MIKIEKYKKYVYNVIFQEFTLFQVVIVIYKRWLETNKPKKIVTWCFSSSFQRLPVSRPKIFLSNAMNFKAPQKSDNIDICLDMATLIPSISLSPIYKLGGDWHHHQVMTQVKLRSKKIKWEMKLKLDETFCSFFPSSCEIFDPSEAGGKKSENNFPTKPFKNRFHSLINKIHSGVVSFVVDL